MKEHMISADSVLKSADIELKYVEFSCDDPLHIHSGIEIVYIMDGMSEHIVNGKRMRMKSSENNCFRYQRSFRICLRKKW